MPRVRLLASLLAVVVAGAALPGSASPAPRAGSAAPKVWTAKVCTSMKTWKASLVRRSNAISTTKPKSLAQLHDAFAAFLSAVVADTDTLIARTKAAGTPAVPHGADLAGALVTGFTKLRRYFAADAAKAKRLSKTDARAFSAGAAALGDLIDRQATEIGTTFDSLDKKYPSPPLDKAMKSTKACRGIG